MEAAGFNQHADLGANVAKYRESQISSKIRILANTTQTTL